MVWAPSSFTADFNAEEVMKEAQLSKPHVARGIAIFLFAVFWLEIFLQAGIYFWSGKPFSSLNPYVWSPYGLVRNNPRLNSPGYHINSNGFREIRDYSQSKPPNTLRVMLLGGSVLYAGLGGANPLPGVPRVTSAETISQYLTGELQRNRACRGKNIEVINAAVNFNRISELAPAYLNDYINWDPDLVIVGSSLNNFGGSLTSETKAGMLLGPHAWESEFQRLVNDTGLASTVEVVIRRLSDNFAIVAVARKAVQKAAHYLVPQERQSTAARPGRSDPMDMEDTNTLNERNLQRFSSYASAMISAAETRKQAMMFFWEYFLWNSAEFKPMSEDEVKLQQLNPPADLNPFYLRQRDWMRRFLEQKGVALIDPMPEMANYKGTIFIDYGHYTAGGNAFMAGVIAKRLVAKGICPS